MCELAEPDDYCTVWNWEIRTARKRHVCDACGGFVEPKKKYMLLHSLFDGSWSTEKICTPCRNAKEKFDKEHGREFGPSTFADALVDCIDAREDGVERWKRVHARMRARASARHKETLALAGVR